MSSNTPFFYNEEEDLVNIEFIEDFDQYLFIENPYIENEEEDIE